MKILGLLLFLCGIAAAQNVRYDNVAYGPKGPVPFATVGVCYQPLSGANTSTTPCTPIANLCSSISDTTCTSPNPVTTDSVGNFHFYVKPGQVPFTVQIYGTQVISPYVLTDQGLSTYQAGAVIPVEAFGAVGDWNGTTGTDNTTAIQNCINALTAGVCVFQAKAYKITAALSIAKNSVGLIGPTTCSSNTAAFTNPPTCAQIVQTSSSADIIDIAGTNSTSTIAYNKVYNVRLSRSVIPSGSAKGLSVVFASLADISHVNSEDSIYDFYFKDLANGLVRDSFALWGHNGVTETSGSVYGFYLDSTGGVGSPSPQFDHDSAASDGLIPGVTSYGFAATGALLADLYFSNTVTFKMSYGFYFNNTGVAATTSTDIHLVNPVDDTCFTFCIQITGITGTLDITGGWSNGLSGYTDNIDIESSTNVSIVNHRIFTSGTGNPAVVCHNSTNTLLVDVTSTGGGVLSYNGCTGGSIDALNVFGATASPIVNFVNSSNIPITNVSLMGNTSAVGFQFDSASHNNSGLETDTCGSGITTCISDSGGNNKVTSGALAITSSNGNKMLCSGTLPTISSGFNAGTIGGTANGTCSFFVTVGTGTASSTGVLTLPTATSGWVCWAENQSRAAVVSQTTSNTTTATLTNYGTTFAATNWTNGDNILITCLAN